MENKIIIYPLLFIILFFYYSARYYSNLFKINNKVNKITKYPNIIYVIDILTVLFIGFYIYYFLIVNNDNNDKGKYQTTIILIAIIYLFIVSMLNNLFFNINYNFFNTFMKYYQILIFGFLSYQFYKGFIDDGIIFTSPEFAISILMIILYTLLNAHTAFSNYFYMMDTITNSDLSLMSEECFKIDHTKDGKDTVYLNEIKNKYGDNYLKLNNGNVPIQYFNKKAKQYMDLTLSDFYYPGSYYTYISQSPFNGVPSYEAIKNALVKFRCRFIHLDIYNDSGKNHIRPPVLRANSSPLDILKTFELISKYGWLDAESSFPLYLYLNFDSSVDTKSYNEIFKIFMKVFSKYLVDKKYGYAGRNGQFPISHTPISETLGKIILVTNEYPTRSLFDEIINCSSNKLDQYFNINIYKNSYIAYEKVGLSVDNNKNTLTGDTASNIYFYRTVPEMVENVLSEEKSGVFNPSFQDCAQYGIQGTLMYLFMPDDNLNKWFLYFKNKNNMRPILKDEKLRTTKPKAKEVIKQNPVLGFQKPQKYCLIPGFMETNKSNITGELTNNTCDVS